MSRESKIKTKSWRVSRLVGSSQTSTKNKKGEDVILSNNRAFYLSRSEKRRASSATPRSANKWLGGEVITKTLFSFVSFVSLW